MQSGDGDPLVFRVAMTFDSSCDPTSQGGRETDERYVSPLISANNGKKEATFFHPDDFAPDSLNLCDGSKSYITLMMLLVDLQLC